MISRATTFLSIFLLVIGVALAGGRTGNLVKNAGFEEGDTMPFHWGSRAKRNPKVRPTDDETGRVKEGENILWVKKKAGGRCIKFALDEDAPKWASISETTGMGYYSDYIPISTGTSYTFGVDARSVALKPGTLGPTPLVFVRGFREFPGKGRRRVWEVKMTCRPERPGEWNHFEEYFEIHTKGVQWIKVKLYAYNRRGTVYFDDVFVVPGCPEGVKPLGRGKVEH